MKSNNRKILSYIILAIIFLISILEINTNFIENSLQRGYNILEDYRLSKIQQINIKDEFLQGNSQSNINNHGIVAETKDSFFYALDTTVYKSDKNFKSRENLFIRPEKHGRDSINIVDDWIFYRNNEVIQRMKIDGSSMNTIFKGYPFDMSVIGNWIYFINFDDDNLYKMDLNGRNREVLVNENLVNMTIYDEKIYYSYEEDEEYYLEKSNLDGSKKELLIKVEARNLVVDDDYIYYIDGEFKLFRLTLRDKTIEKLSHEDVFNFIKDDKWIFYILKGEEDELGSKGLYRMDIDGNNLLELDKDSNLDEIGLGITEDWIFYYTINDDWESILKRIDKYGENAGIIEEEELDNAYEKKLN